MQFFQTLTIKEAYHTMKQPKIIHYHVKKRKKYIPIYHPDAVEKYFIVCCQCDLPIAPHGGPVKNAVCLTCYNPEYKDDKIESRVPVGKN